MLVFHKAGCFIEIGLPSWNFDPSIPISYYFYTKQDLLLTRIQNGDYKFSDGEWSGISPEAKDLIRRLLERDVKARLSAHQVLKHPWVVQEQPETPLLTPGALKR